MKASQTSSCVIAHASLRRTAGGSLLAFVLALTLLAAAPRGFAQTLASVLPGTINSSTKSVAVDSVWHYVYTVNTSNQVQVSYVHGGWVTAPLGSGEAVQTGTLLYVDTGYHYIFYVGANDRLYCWLYNGAWRNFQLDLYDGATDLVGVDSNFHHLFYRNGATLSFLYYNGSQWASLNVGVSDYAGLKGGAVDQASHALYWNDSAAGLRALFYSGRAYEGHAIALDPNANSSGRPAVNQSTGAVFTDFNSSNNPPFALYQMAPILNSFFAASVGDNVTDTNNGAASIAVNPTTGKVIYSRIGGDLAVLTPTGSGISATWTRTLITPGPSGISVAYSDLDQGTGDYFFTTSQDTSLHVAY